MIANLGMYDLAPLSSALDDLWSQIRTALLKLGVDAPEGLNRKEPLWSIWTDANLVLGQTCGLPYRKDLHGRLHLLGAFDYGLFDTPRGYYHSVLVARTHTLAPLTGYANARLAVNGFDSESGWAAASRTAADAGFAFRQFLHTGAHVESVAAVREGRADIAAVDAVTWRILQQQTPSDVDGLSVVTRSQPTPGLPLITGLAQDPERVRSAVIEGLDALPTSVRDRLGIKGFVPMTSDDYLTVSEPGLPSQAKARPAPETLHSLTNTA